MAITMEDVKKLREKTGAGVMATKQALEEADGDMEKAEEKILEKGLAKAEKKADRETGEGLVYAYIHHDGKSGAMVKLLCETDFVARTDDFEMLAKEIAMQVVSMRAETVAELLEQEYMRDPSKTIERLIKEHTASLGENIQLESFERMSIG